ncbi:MAG TPA: proton-conducting transporter membrane subunit, partial [Chroococcales cyanobacterium]
MDILFKLAIIPAACACLSGLVRQRILLRRTVSTLLWLQTALACYLLVKPLSGDAVSLNADFRIDQISAVLIVLSNFVVAAACTHASTLYGQDKLVTEARMFFGFTSIFLIAMNTVFACDNLGYMWVSIEASTLFSAPLVYLDRSKNAVEATWKYLIICSVGIAFALLGTVMIFAAAQSPAHSSGTLQISQLVQSAVQLDPSLLRLGFIFCLIGYGTKAGVFPLHNWLPDAYSQAPPPACAIFSGALINCALFGLYRVSQIMQASQHGLASLHIMSIA